MPTPPRPYLASDTDRDVMLQADVEARSAGIGGVPFFIFNRKVGVSGAQESDTLLQAMEQASRGSDGQSSCVKSGADQEGRYHM